ncbi:hypothetical protein HXX76_013634 [Chlamydomonas incerta]|uniref:Uncharacterized protein n=1 Tax=Chlamydomonas incerta TaxID=51695 RepID=A0A835VUD3_CHLIN|nr:hypothetical protein HXX76_013634 [Chlamydomonas incerta]|eukprot:KAG2425591.1 hypothetical protein HXX76_013634 [Chlamydomonas incerta]
MLTSDFVEKLVFISSTGDKSSSGEPSPAGSTWLNLARPLVVIIQSLSPGLSSYSVFVEALHVGGLESETSTDDEERLQARLFGAATRAILERPTPPGPGRLAFSAVPQHGAEAMLAVLREAGYDKLWDEPCYRYALRLPVDAAELQNGQELLRSLQAQGLAYQLDTLRRDRRLAAHAAPLAAHAAPRHARAPVSEAVRAQDSAPASAPVAAPAPEAQGDIMGPAAAGAAARAGPDALLVDSLWTYRSAHSLALVQLLVEHRQTVCVRLGRDASAASAGAAAAAGGGGAATAPAGPRSETAVTAEGPPAASLPAVPAQSPNLSTEVAPSLDEESDAVAWILQYADGSVGMAHTQSGHRRRGLMRLALMEMVRRLLGSDGPSHLPPRQQEACCAQQQSQQQAQATSSSGAAAGSPVTVDASAGAAQAHTAGARQDEVFAFIVLENAASVALFEGLGFRRCERAYHWFGVEGGG